MDDGTSLTESRHPITIRMVIRLIRLPWLVIALVLSGVAGVAANPATAQETGRLLIEEAAHYRDLGRRHQAAGEIQKAIDDYSRAVLSYPEYADAYNDLGIMYEAQGNLAKAEWSYLQALQIAPRYAGAHMNLALLYEAQGKLDKAAPHWQTRVRMGPVDDPWVKDAVTRLTAHHLDVPKLDDIAVQASVAYDEGTYLLARNRDEEALHAFEKALGIDPRHRGARDGVVEARRRLRLSQLSSGPVARSPDRPATALYDPTVRTRPNSMVRTDVMSDGGRVYARQKVAEQRVALEEYRTHQRNAQRLFREAEGLERQAAVTERRAAAQAEGPKQADLLQQATLTRKRAQELRRQAQQQLGDMTPAVTMTSSTTPAGRAPAMTVTSSSVAPRPAGMSSPATARPTPTPAPPPMRPAPVTPISTPRDAQALAEQLAQEKRRVRDVMVRELYQRGLILYRQQQYAQAIEQFQRALAIDPDHRDSQQYLREAQSALARGGQRLR